MTFRARMLVAVTGVALAPLLVFGYGVQREMTERLSAQEDARVATLTAAVDGDLRRTRLRVADRLAALTQTVATDNRFRVGVRLQSGDDRAYVLDYAESAMRLLDLDVLWVLDRESGRIASSGHFRNEYDRIDRVTPALLRRTAGEAITYVRTPERAFLALLRLDSFRLAERSFDLIGGIAVEQRLLQRSTGDPHLTLGVQYPGDEFRAPVNSADASVVWQHPFAFLNTAAVDSNGQVRQAAITVTRTPGALTTLRRRVNVWLIAALAATGVLAVLVATSVAARMSRPLADLARKTAEVDLDRLDVDFGSSRRDEVGALSRLLAALTGRLRDGTARLREAERRATVGDLARQVNHDIKNGLIPIRNVFRHLGEVARDDPHSLAAVFDERRGNVTSSIEYLEALAGNYARLTPAAQLAPCDINAVVVRVARDVAGATGVRPEIALAPQLPPLVTDEIVLRRIIENLVGNAVDAAETGHGTVMITTEPVGRGVVRVTVHDTGKGMTESELTRAFDDFYTTKPTGTGLGLSIARRLVTDLGGTLRVRTEPGTGTVVQVELPVQGPPLPPAA